MSVPLSRIVAAQVADRDAAHEGASTMTPVAFGGRFGWLHQPAVLHDGAAGVVLVSPIGREARCAHRPMRLLADRLARAGYPTLRYDHIGHGDSLDLTDDGDALPEWIAGVRAAADFLKTEAGQRPIVLGGVRLGASLAALAADGDKGIDGLMLLAPVVSGKAWLRELRLAGAMSGTVSEVAAAAGGLEADGLALSPATARGLAAVNLKTLDRPPAHVLLVVQNELVAALGEPLKARGAAVSEQDFAGYDPLFEDAHSNQAPEAVFAQAVDWLKAAMPIDHEAGTLSGSRALSCLLEQSGWMETPVAFGAGLWGLLTRPDATTPVRKAVIFLNTGGDPRAGIGRFAAEASRALAAQGIASLRFDFPGVGDSADPADGRRHIYEVSRLADVRAAMALMAAEGYADVTLTGVCAGGHHAIQAAIADTSVRKALAISPVKLVWRAGDSLAVGKRDQGRATAFYVSGLTNPTTWKRLLTGDIHVFSVLKTLTTRLASRFAARRDDGTKAFRDQVLAVSDRGGKVRIIVGIDDASLDEVETYFGPKGAQLDRLPGMAVSVVPGVDHGLARSESRRHALADLIALVGED